MDSLCVVERFQLMAPTQVRGRESPGFCCLQAKSCSGEDAGLGRFEEFLRGQSGPAQMGYRSCGLLAFQVRFGYLKLNNFDTRTVVGCLGLRAGPWIHHSFCQDDKRATSR